MILVGYTCLKCNLINSTAFHKSADKCEEQRLHIINLPSLSSPLPPLSMAPALGNRLTARPVAVLGLTVERTEAEQIPKTPLLCFIIVIILKSLVSSRRSVSLGAVACSGYSFACIYDRKRGYQTPCKPCSSRGCPILRLLNDGTAVESSWSDGKGAEEESVSRRVFFNFILNQLKLYDTINQEKLLAKRFAEHLKSSSNTNCSFSYLTFSIFFLISVLSVRVISAKQFALSAVAVAPPWLRLGTL